MYIESLNVTNFRNFSHVDVALSAGINVLHGANGAGKTNLLEAVFMLCLGRSQRRAADAVLVKQNEEMFRIEGQIRQGKVAVKVAVAYQKAGRKKITIDAIPVRAAQLYRNYCAVALGPEDTEILSGPPSTRRSFLDIYLSQFSGEYLAHLTDYYKVLAQKNACLKGGGDVTPFNELLINHGVQVIKRRSDFVEQLSRLSQRRYAQTSGEDSLRMRYRPSVTSTAEDTDLYALRHSFETTLEKNLGRERALETSLIGPHRDDISFEIGGYPARTHASQGEWRTAAIAVKLAVYQLLKEKRRMRPILLLDEIFAELDPGRSAALMQSLGDLGQVLVTAAVDPPESLCQSGSNFRIERGTVRSMN